VQVPVQPSCEQLASNRRICYGGASTTPRFVEPLQVGSLSTISRVFHRLASTAEIGRLSLLLKFFSSLVAQEVSGHTENVVLAPKMPVAHSRRARRKLHQERVMQNLCFSHTSTHSASLPVGAKHFERLVLDHFVELEAHKGVMLTTTRHAFYSSSWTQLALGQGW
jgi:hypothetical protein